MNYLSLALLLIAALEIGGWFFISPQMLVVISSEDGAPSISAVTYGGWDVPFIEGEAWYITCAEAQRQN